MPQRHKRNKALMYNELRAIGRKCKGWIVLYPSVFGRCQENISLSYTLSLSLPKIYFYLPLSLCVCLQPLFLCLSALIFLYLPLSIYVPLFSLSFSLSPVYPAHSILGGSVCAIAWESGGIGCFAVYAFIKKNKKWGRQESRSRKIER
jgi:hypothetical protein